MALVKYNNNSISAVTSAAAISSGALVPIKTLTASSSATLSFVDGSSDVVLDSTYPIYKFEFINMHPANNGVNFTFQVDTGTNTNYNQTITSTAFQAFHGESGGSPTLGYGSDKDQAQGTAFQVLMQPIGNGNDESGSGTLQLFNPSSSTFVKHFIGTTQYYNDGDYSQTLRTAGYINTTTALTRVQFKFSSGNIDAGKIKLYGIKDS